MVRCHRMRLLVSSLTAVTALAVCTFGEPTVFGTSHEEKGIPLSQSGHPATPQPQRSAYRNPSILTGIDIFFSPYRLMNLDRPSYDRSSPNIRDGKTKMWFTKVGQTQEKAQFNELKNDLKNAIKVKENLLYGTDASNIDFLEYGPDPGLAITYDYGSADKFNEEKIWRPDLKSEKITEKAQTDFNYTPAKPKDEHQQSFALSPQDDGYFDNLEEDPQMHYMMRRGDGFRVESIAPVFHDMRQLRQNPQKVKTLVQDHPTPKEMLESLRSQIPVSLIPTNLQRLKLLQRSHSEARARAGGDILKVHVFPSDDDIAASLYVIAIFTAMGAALFVTVVGVAYGWYIMSKKSKAAADVDYPAYGVTGPSGDNSAERKLAQSAHMYHYQHQKQQIIAMERNVGTELGSVSDAESEEENEEGDYTVYECPGYATTGDMEVKNPMFSDDQATPAPAATPAAASPAIVVNCDVD